jgi:uncharacterized membrane protein
MSPENFTLTENDNAGWAPTLDNHSFVVQPGGSKTTTLRVMVSWSSPPGTSDNITVRVALAADENVWVENSCIANSVSTLEENILSTDDVYVNEYSPDSNYGSAERLYVGRLADEVSPYENVIGRTFLKFDIRKIPGSIDNAWVYLRVCMRYGPPAVLCYGVDNDGWTEGTITWNNQPATNEVLDNHTVTETQGKWAAWRVTDFVKQQNDGFVSLSMVCAIENLENYAASFFSEEAIAGAVYLRVVYHIDPHSMLTTISPSYGVGLRGTTIEYQVTVKNVYWENSSYSLESLDNLGWPMALDNDHFDNIPPGENRTTILRVTIPDNSVLDTRDNIRVIVKSIENENVMREGTCVAHHVITPVTFRVSISPSFQSRFRGENLTYTVTVTNTTSADFRDNYTLTISDNSGWPLSLPENRIENVLGRGESKSKTFTVTISDNAAPCTRDNITITARSQVDSTVENSASCIAHSLSVDISITPSENSALPGENLTYTVKVWSTSTSSENDNFRLTVSENISWNPSISPENIGVSAIENGQATLKVTIPENAVACTRDNITITVTSWKDNTVKDNASCTAHAGYVDLEVSISPKYQNGFPGGTISYSVLVTNTGTVLENFELVEVTSDNENWVKNYFTTTTYKNILPGDSEDRTLEVTVPSDAAHCTTDNITIRWKATHQPYENENIGYKYAEDNCTAHAIHLKILFMPLSPELKEGLPGGNITWSITIANVGLENDNYTLTVVDDAGWENLRFDDNFFPDVPVGEARMTYLRIRIPDNATGGMKDNLKVTVTSGKDPNTSENDNCSVLVGSVARAGAKVTISPSENDGLPGGTLTYTITITNTGNIYDNYTLTISDNSGWPLSLTGNKIENLGPGDDGTKTFTVTIPENARTCMKDNIRVRATSAYDNKVSAENSCIAHVGTFTRGARVSITPSSQENIAGGSLTFTVAVTNTGDVVDNFMLAATDNENWTPTLSTSSVRLEGGASENLVLTVGIPDNAAVCTRDNIRVTARSKYDNTVSAENSCLVHVIAPRRGVRISVSPSTQENSPGGTLRYTVTVTNTGDVADNYDLIKSDTKTWTLSLQSTISVPENSSRTATLTVTIPATAENNTIDNITIIARSRTDNTIENRASCIAHALVTAPPQVYGVQVSISPSEDNGQPGETLTFTVTVTNTGEVTDTYDLTASDDAVWGAQLDENVLTILASGNTTVTVSVTVPSGASDGDSTMITVTATSRGDPTKSDSATCTATATTAPPPPPSHDFLPIAVGGAAVGGGVAAIAVLLKKGIIHLPSIRSRFLRSLNGKINILYIVAEINSMKRPEGGNEWFK